MASPSPYKQSALVGVNFLLVFVAYDTIQVYAKRLYSEYGSADLGTNMTFCIYVFFTVSEIVASGMVNKLGSRLSMLLGVLGYASLVLAGLIYCLTQGDWDWLVLLSGCVLGIGASLLWTGQGRFLLEHASDSNRGALFSIFWSLYRCASIVGGGLSFFYFTVDSSKGSAGLFVIFLVFVLISAIGMLFLKEAPGGNEIASPSWQHEAAGMCRMCRNQDMLLLSGLFFASGLIEPYVLSGFTDRYFSKKATGMELMIFFTMSLLGTSFCGWILDGFTLRGRQRAGMHIALATLTFVHVAGLVCAGLVEFSLAGIGLPPAGGWELTDSQMLLPSAAFALCGLSDAMINTYIYWMIGGLFSTGADKARAIAYSKLLNCAAHVLGYGILPTHRCSGSTQLLLNLTIFLIGTGLAWPVTLKPQERLAACEPAN